MVAPNQLCASSGEVAIGYSLLLQCYFANVGYMQVRNWPYESPFDFILLPEVVGVY